METCANAPQILSPPFEGEEDLSPENLLPDRLIPNCSDCLLQKEIAELRKEIAELRCQVGYWKSLHKKAIQREEKAQKELEEAKATIRLRDHQLFGDKSEKHTSLEASSSTDPKEKKEKKPRGQQKGSQGHGRRDNSHLPAQEEIRDLPEDEKFCPCCGCPFEEFPGTEDSVIYEIKVIVYRRVIKRKRYKPTCQCGDKPGIITAPPVSEAYSQRPVWNFHMGGDFVGQVRIPASDESFFGRLENAWTLAGPRKPSPMD